MPRKGRGSDTGSENPELVGTFETLRDEGEHFVHVQQYAKAIESFTRALEMNPEDKNCLVTRSKCWLQLGNAENALTDAEEALNQDREFIRGLYQKAEAMYQLGDFETALVFFHRGHKLRPELQEFRLGIQKAQEAINNSIGTPDSVKLSAQGDLTYFYKQEEDKKKGYSKPAGVRKEKAKEKERPKTCGDQKTIRQLLGELYGDKDFLEKLLGDPALTGGQNTMNRDIKVKVLDGLNYLDMRVDFWRQQKPMYARKRDREKQRQSAKSRQNDPTDYLLRCLEEIDEEQVKGRYEQSLTKAKKTLNIVENMPEKQLQNKEELLANLHSQIGNAYLELGKYSLSLEHHEEDLRIANSFDLDDAKSRAFDNLGRVYARKGKYEKAIEVWEEKLPMSKSPLESTWLYHEIGRCYLELQKYQDARDFGEKSLAAAREAEDDGWQLHASVLVAQSEVKLNDLQAACDSFERSLELAKRAGDRAAEDAITKALKEVNENIVKGVKEGDVGDDDDKGSYRGGDEEPESEGGKDDYDDDFEDDNKDMSRKTSKDSKKVSSVGQTKNNGRRIKHKESESDQRKWSSSSLTKSSRRSSRSRKESKESTASQNSVKQTTRNEKETKENAEEENEQSLEVKGHVTMTEDEKTRADSKMESRKYSKGSEKENDEIQKVHEANNGGKDRGGNENERKKSEQRSSSKSPYGNKGKRSSVESKKKKTSKTSVSSSEKKLSVASNSSSSSQKKSVEEESPGTDFTGGSKFSKNGDNVAGKEDVKAYDSQNEEEGHMLENEQSYMEKLRNDEQSSEKEDLKDIQPKEGENKQRNTEDRGQSLDNDKGHLNDGETKKFSTESNTASDNMTRQGDGKDTEQEAA